ncbi:MAG: hypothetical protein EOP88_05710 [Verrucomicrobiaceae bacterium]|nr:MAG: hypothetical protein EOP88_05710 [Verrucomicrobiaceae bacterium]
MTPISLLRRSAFAAFAALSVTAASAHSVWIETVEGKLVVRFGEVGVEHEKSPGHLDELSLPTAKDAKGEKIETEKAADHFLLKAAKPENSAVIFTMFPVMERPATETKPASARWPQFYARWQVAGAAVEPVSALDIVPAKEGGKATVYFKGKPLPAVEVVQILPDGKEKYLTTGADGTVTFTAEGKGLHVLRVAGYSENTTGTHEGKNYTVISHNSSVAWNQ